MKSINSIISFGAIFLVPVFCFLSGARAELIVDVDGGGHQSQAQPQKDQYLSYNFGQVFIPNRASVNYYLKNTGDAPIEIKKITISGAFFDAASNCPDVLEAGKQCLTRIFYSPAFEGFNSGTLVWYTSDNNVYLRLWGQGVRM